MDSQLISSKNIYFTLREYLYLCILTSEQLLCDSCFEIILNIVYGRNTINGHNDRHTNASFI